MQPLRGQVPGPGIEVIGKVWIDVVAVPVGAVEIDAPEDTVTLGEVVVHAAEVLVRLIGRERLAAP